MKKLFTSITLSLTLLFTFNYPIPTFANLSPTISKLTKIRMIPSSVNSVLGGSQTITLETEDMYGNSIPNLTMYLQTGIKGLWVTQVNGNTITGSVNMGTLSSTSIQTVNTPVPLFCVTNTPTYASASVAGLTASDLNTASPIVALITGVDGTVSITLADGNVTYVANTASATATNSFAVDAGTPINKQLLNFYSDSAQTQKLNEYYELISFLANTNTSPTITRLSGTDRYSTAASIARQGWTQSDYCILTYGENYPDALSAVPLAKKYNAPILLTTSSSLPDTTKQELIDLQTKNVIIIGGTGVISTSIESELQSMGITPTRIAGQDRYETSVKIAQQIGSPTELFVATGEDYPDALSIAPIAGTKQAPIILVPKDNMPDSVRSYISSLDVSKTYVVGNSDIIDDSVCNQFYNPERITGADKYSRNIAINQKFNNIFNSNSVCLATGEGFADALTGAVYASKILDPIVLVKNASPDKTISYYQQRLAFAKNIYVFGGTGVISDSLIQGLNGTTNPTTPSINVTTVAGMAPALPPTVTTTMSDDTTSNVAVTWSNIDASQYASAGTFTVNGTIDNSTVQAVANVTVNLAEAPTITITSASASVINDTITVTLSRPAWSDYSVPIAKPAITDFSVTASGVDVTPTAISTTGAVVTLTVPTTTTDQPIVYSVSYQGGTSVVANKQVTDIEPNSVMVGQPFNVVLVAVTDGGYNWTYTTDTEAIKFVQLTNGSLSEAMVVGSGTEEVFTFQATQAGSFKLHFSEGRWWVGADGSPIDNADYTINVK